MVNLILFDLGQLVFLEVPTTRLTPQNFAAKPAIISPRYNHPTSTSGLIFDKAHTNLKKSIAQSFLKLRIRNEIFFEAR